MPNENSTKPFLKWAGGKTQLLPAIENLIPQYNSYIEPFLGGGALFFHLQPAKAILADSNPELINCYEVVKSDVKKMMSTLEKYENEKEFFYKIRSQNLNKLNDIQRAARFYYLNRTCFNGLYRVNKKGEFNVPFGRNNLKSIYDKERLLKASKALQNAKLICDDYKAVIRKYAQEGDFVFLDPPYVPVSEYGDFQRYTKEFFYDEDHLEVRDEFNRLIRIGAKVLLTNSNSPFVNELYKGHTISVFDTKRMINSMPSNRIGQDVIIFSKPGKKIISTKEELLENFPGTRYMGSKYKLLPFLWNSIKHLKCETALDAFSGSGCVSYLFKKKGIEVYSNDFMSFSSNITKALIENSTQKLNSKDIERLLKTNINADSFIAETFKGLYFSDSDNEFLDNLRANIELLEDPYKRALALAAIIRACMKKRPRGIFTYVGERYDDGRRDLQLSLREHFLENVEAFNNAVFDNGKKNLSFNKNVFDLNQSADLVYFDPPYLTSKSDNDYVRRYHFVEGLFKNWKGLEIDYGTKTKKFKKYASAFDSKDTVNEALDRLFKKYKNSILVVSYSSNSIPAKKEMMELLKKYKKEVILEEIDYQYSFGNQNSKIGDNANRVKEYLFIAK